MEKLGVGRKSIFSRMVITFLLIIFPIYGLSLAIYYWSIQTQKEDISNTTLSQVSFYLESLEKEIQRIKLLQYYCTSDVNLQQLASVPESLDEFEKILTVTRLQEHLQAIASSSTYISSVNAYIPSMNRIVSSGSYESSIPKDEFDVLSENSHETAAAQTVYWNNRLFLSVTNLTNSQFDPDKKSRRTPAYIVAVELNLKTLAAALKQFNNYEDGGALLIDLRNNFMLTSTNHPREDAAVAGFVKETVKTARSGSRTVKIDGKPYWTSFITSDYLGITLSKFIPEREVLKNFQKYFLWFWIFTGTSVLLILLYSFSTYRMIYKPLSLLVKSFRKIEKGDLNIAITHKADDEFRYLYVTFNQMVCELGTLIDQVYKQKILAQNAQLKQLQMQINPHFLYNSFFILNSMSRTGNYEQLEHFTGQLGEYFQFITRSGADEVPLCKEVNHARVYAELQAMRFSRRLKVQFDDLPEEYSGLIVPRLILQPIIENAFEHGLEKKMKDGLLRVDFLGSQGKLDILIEDNGGTVRDEDLERMQSVLSSNEESMEVTGMINIHRRIQLKFGPRSGVRIGRGESGGLKVTVSINCKEEDADVQAADC